MFYGSKGSNPLVTDKLLPESLIAEIVKDYRADTAAMHTPTRTPSRLTGAKATQQDFDEAGRAANGFLKGCKLLVWSSYKEWLNWATWAIGLDHAFNTNIFYSAFVEASRHHPKYNPSDEKKITREFPKLHGTSQSFEGLGLCYDPTTKQVYDPSQPRQTGNYFDDVPLPSEPTIYQPEGVTEMQERLQTYPSPQPKKQQRIKWISDSQLLALKPEPVKWIVEGLISVGLTQLAAPPKAGKSWLTLNIAASVASGALALGTQKTIQGSVLALTLEDSENTLNERYNLMTGGQATGKVYFGFKAPRLDKGLIAELEEAIKAIPDVKLIIIDTFPKIRPGRKSNASLQQEDYEELDPLNEFGKQHSVAILLVRHTRKSQSNNFDDILEEVAGSNGATAACDNILILKRPRSTPEATLYRVMRNCPDETPFSMKLDKAFGIWTITGSAENKAISEARQEILEALELVGTPLTPEAIAIELGKKRATIRKLLRDMLKDGQLLQDTNSKYYVPGSPALSTITHNDSNENFDTFMQEIPSDQFAQEL